MGHNRNRLIRIGLAIAIFPVTLAGCGGSETGEGGEGESAPEATVPSVLRTRFETEMKTILHDVQRAQEQAAALSGGYVDWGELQRSYLSRAIPESYDVRVSEVSASGYRAEVVHRGTGLRCQLAVGLAGSRGVPACD